MDHFEDLDFFKEHQARQKQRKMIRVKRIASGTPSRGQLEHLALLESLEIVPNGYYSFGRQSRNT